VTPDNHATPTAPAIAAQTVWWALSDELELVPHADEVEFATLPKS
jgi:hypothetical protein